MPQTPISLRPRKHICLYLQGFTSSYCMKDADEQSPLLETRFPTGYQPSIQLIFEHLSLSAPCMAPLPGSIKRPNWKTFQRRTEALHIAFIVFLIQTVSRCSPSMGWKDPTIIRYSLPPTKAKRALLLGMWYPDPARTCKHAQYLEAARFPWHFLFLNHSSNTAKIPAPFLSTGLGIQVLLPLPKSQN